MKKALVLGGTRYFGRHLVEALLRDGYSVTVASRGNVELNFSKPVTHIKADREKIDDLMKLADAGPYQFIFDQICMSARAADSAVRAFSGRCEKYIFTSTGSVYDVAVDRWQSEDKFDFKKYPPNLVDTDPYNYQEAKRQAEVVFGNQSAFAAVMVRFPIVLGTDDYTQRLKFHVDRVMSGGNIYFPSMQMKMTFVHSQEAGEFLKFIAESDFTGAINCASDGTITMKDFVEQIEKMSGKKAHLLSEEHANTHSPYGFKEDFLLPNDLGKKSGFRFRKLGDYLPSIIQHYINTFDEAKNS